jgi:hypothetical protein
VTTGTEEATVDRLTIQEAVRDVLGAAGMVVLAPLALLKSVAVLVYAAARVKV